MKKILNHQKTTDYIAYGAIIIFVFFFIWLSFGRHDALKSYLNDISAYDQAIWNTVHGHFMQISISAFDEPNMFASRFSPSLLFFVPFYMIYSSPKWLLLFQALAAGASAVPIYLLAKEKLKSAGLGLVFLLSYLLYPVLHNGLLYDFHEIVFAVGFAAWAFYFIEKRNDKLFILFSVLLILTQEYLALLVFGMAVYQMFIKKRWRFGVTVGFSALLYYAVILLFVMPHLAQSGKPGFLADTGAYASRYTWLGSSPTEMIKNMIIHPIQMLEVVFSPARLKYIFLLAAPVFSLALYSWPMAIILPVLPLYLLSSNPMTYNIFFYHSAIFAPFVFFSAIFSYERWFKDGIFLRRLFAGLILFFSIATSVIFGVSPLSMRYTMCDYMPDAHAQRIKEIKRMVPRDATLSVQHNLGPHFSERQYVYRYPLKTDDVQYILLDKTDPYRDNQKQTFLFPYALQMDFSEWENSIEKLKKSTDFDLIYDNDGYLLFRRK
jgi:uncharacterized membrane protein